ncbi:HAD family hydrolase [Anatilimnocola sp. NA78]|uniref:HAD family hydrolase n=1 Tax=Anatilimnocola sp. NA78 TaxID=3415683 RepID=UPI003CE4E549
MTKRVSVVIVDLDNTLFDWVNIWHKTFTAMLDELVAKSGISREILIQDCKAVFTERGTSEYAFVIQELACLKAKHPGEDLPKIYESAIQAYRDARRDALALYPTVEDTLLQVKDAGGLVIGYTESMAYYSHYRLRRLGLDRILDFIYSPADHDFPDGVSPDKYRTLPAAEYKLRRTSQRHTPKGEVKPNPAILLQIIKDVYASPDEVVYVGDSLMKDITMAKQAGVLDAWAKYGTAQERPEYELLRQVTHWPLATVEKEKTYSAAEVVPTITLKDSFSELTQHVHFDAFIDRSPEKMKLVVDAWKMTVDVQKHFNELEMKVRNFALTVITAVLAGAAFSIKEQVEFTLLGITVPLSVLILLVGTAVWVAFGLMDRYWYHQLLLGSVYHGLFIEKRYRSILPELGLAHAIGKESPTLLWGWNIRSSTKLTLFYWAGIALLVIAAIASVKIHVRDKAAPAGTIGVTNSAQPPAAQPPAAQPPAAQPSAAQPSAAQPPAAQPPAAQPPAAQPPAAQPPAAQPPAAQPPAAQPPAAQPPAAQPPAAQPPAAQPPAAQPPAAQPRTTTNP